MVQISSTIEQLRKENKIIFSCFLWRNMANKLRWVNCPFQLFSKMGANALNCSVYDMMMGRDFKVWLLILFYFFRFFYYLCPSFSYFFATMWGISSHLGCQFFAGKYLPSNQIFLKDFPPSSVFLLLSCIIECIVFYFYFIKDKIRDYQSWKSIKGWIGLRIFKSYQKHDWFKENYILRRLILSRHETGGCLEINYFNNFLIFL